MSNIELDDITGDQLKELIKRANDKLKNEEINIELSKTVVMAEKYISELNIFIESAKNHLISECKNIDNDIINKIVNIETIYSFESVYNTLLKICKSKPIESSILFNPFLSNHTYNWLNEFIKNISTPYFYTDKNEIKKINDFLLSFSSYIQNIEKEKHILDDLYNKIKYTKRYYMETKKTSIEFTNNLKEYVTLLYKIYNRDLHKYDTSLYIVNKIYQLYTQLGNDILTEYDFTDFFNPTLNYCNDGIKNDVHNIFLKKILEKNNELDSIINEQVTKREHKNVLDEPYIKHEFLLTRYTTIEILLKNKYIISTLLLGPYVHNVINIEEINTIIKDDLKKMPPVQWLNGYGHSEYIRERYMLCMKKMNDVNLLITSIYDKYKKMINDKEIALKKSIENININTHINANANINTNINSINNIKTNILKDMNEETCIICFLHKPVMMARPCNHKHFCTECTIILKSKNNKCPICMCNVTDYERVYD